MTIAVGAEAPNAPGAPEGPHALVFYKVTCPTCQMAAPAFDRFRLGYPGHVAAIGQDPSDELAAFGTEYAMAIPAHPDLAPYDVSNAYGIEHVPTVLVIDGEGIVRDVVESWDREGLNRASTTLASLVGAEPVSISEPGDGLPEFRPG